MDWSRLTHLLDLTCLLNNFASLLLLLLQVFAGHNLIVVPPTQSNDIQCMTQSNVIRAKIASRLMLFSVFGSPVSELVLYNNLGHFSVLIILQIDGLKSNTNVWCAMQFPSEPNEHRIYFWRSKSKICKCLATKGDICDCKRAHLFEWWDAIWEQIRELVIFIIDFSWLKIINIVTSKRIYKNNHFSLF